MASLNRVVLVGNLTRDPELRFTTAGKPVAQFGVAVNRMPYTNEQGERIEGVDFFTVVVFGRQAETSSQYLSKGRQVYIEGRMNNGKYTAKDGSERYFSEVVASHVEFLGSKSEGGNSGGQGQGGQWGNQGGGSWGGGQGGNSGGWGGGQQQGGGWGNQDKSEPVPF